MTDKIKEYKYHCDGGTICIGNDICRACFCNGYGDGEHAVYVSQVAGYMKVSPPPKWSSNKWSFQGSVSGRDIWVLSYDCYHDEEVVDNPATVLCHLSGRYGVYSNNGDIFLEKWD